MLRPTRVAVVLTILCLLLGLAVGCAGTGSSSPHNTAVKTSDAAAAEAVQALSDYKVALQTWVDEYLVAFEDEGEAAFSFRDPMQPTADELQRARAYASLMRTSAAELEQISAPAEVAKAHAQLYHSLCGELNALDRYINALEWESWRDAELAYRQAEEAYMLYVRAMNGLSPYIDVPVALQN